MLISLILYYFIAGIVLPLQRLDGPALLEKSIAFHDPHGEWSTLQVQFDFEETRPDAEPRYTSIAIDNLSGNFCMTRIKDGQRIERHIVDGKCKYLLNGSSEISGAEMSGLRLTEKRTLFMRNYYLYLWGLPMKLQDTGTVVHDVVTGTQFNGKESLKLKVTYEASTGSDSWYFFMDPKTYEMIGYQFYHDEDAGDGEYILLGRSESVFGMKIPNHRTWFTNKDSTLLGTDIFITASHLDPHH
jgi:hypothetical protein